MTKALTWLGWDLGIVVSESDSVIPVFSAQMAGLLCEEEGPEADNVKYCGYCKHHYNKMVKLWEDPHSTS